MRVQGIAQLVPITQAAGASACRNCSAIIIVDKRATAVSGFGRCAKPILVFNPRSRRLPHRLQHGTRQRPRRAPIGAKIVRETVKIAILRAPEQHGHFALLLYANGGTPISAQITLPALLLPTPNAGSIHIDIPSVPSLPGAPNVAVTELNATLGPPGLTYHEHSHGKTTSYHPTGILLPDQCPRGGFSFTASLTFEDGSHATAGVAVPCS